MSTTQRSVELTQPHCDYSGCSTAPTITDGEWVMCPHHEPSAYRTSTYWRSILAIVPRSDGRWPFFRAEY